VSRVGCGPRRGERGKGAGQAGLRPGFQGAASSFLFFSVISKPFLNQFENHFKVVGIISKFGIKSLSKQKMNSPA
jgi:hypothetical protein